MCRCTKIDKYQVCSQWNRCLWPFTELPIIPIPSQNICLQKNYEKMARGGDSTAVSIFVVILVILFNQLYLQLFRRQCCLKRSGALERKPKCKVESMAMSMSGPASAMGCSNIWTHIRLLVAQSMIAWPSIRRGNS